MAKVYTDNQDELTIANVLKSGLRQGGLPKWTVLRLALARSIRIDGAPDESFDRRQTSAGGGEYSLEQLTGQGKNTEEDATILIKALLSEYHGEDLFFDEDVFVKYLQRHVRRGLREFRSGWMESHDFHDFLLNELFGDIPSQGTVNDNGLEEKLPKALAEIGIAAQVTERFDGPRLSRYLVRLQDAKDYTPLLRGLDKLGFVLGLGDLAVLASTTNEPKIAALDVPRLQSHWRHVQVASLESWLSDAPGDWRVPVYLGQDVKGQNFGFDLSTAPHLLVGGTTGSGKSVCLHSLILSVLRGPSGRDVRLVLIDPKRVEFAPYAKLGQLLHPIMSEASDVLGCLNELVAEMNTREELLAKRGARDIDDDRAKVSGISRIFVFVEELADLLLQLPAIEEPLVRLAQKARATGIHLILATQRPDAKTFSGLLRSNVPSRIALTVQKSSESKIILDEIGAEKLLGRGDMLVKLLGQQTVRVHGVYIASDDISRLAYPLTERRAR